MTTRWWAPDGPHIGPDERDFELLIPVDDARHDLGAALLALHRVGAAACEEVALHAIPDEVSLVSALASARTAFAVPLVESVSKSVGEGPYAGLLVRDVIDDAENAALSVFRTLVSKGVPPTLAVQRVGMVYGVPQSDLGNYLSVAGELRVHPAALTDAADRALFSAIEKIATDELESKPQPWEPVQKATPDEPPTRIRRQLMPDDRQKLMPDDDEYLEEHNVTQDPATGRFIRGSLSGPPAVGEAPTRSTRSTRATRSTRSTRSARAKAPKAREGAARQAGQRGPGVGRDVSRLRKSRDEMSETEKNRLISLNPVTWSDGDFTDKIEFPSTQGPFAELDQELAIGLSTEEWAKLQAHMGRDEQGRLAFRMGHVAQEGRDVNVFGRTSDYDEDEHRKVLKKLAADAWDDVEEEFPGQDVHKPIAVTIDDDQLNNLEPEQLQDHIKAMKTKAVAQWLENQGADLSSPESQRYIDDAVAMMSSTRSPDNKGDVYHYIPRVGGNAVAPRVSVIELVFEPGVFGRDDGHGVHTNYKLDPNQMMRIENGRPSIIYDPKLHAYRQRYFITPIYPDVSKADYLDEHNVTQGPGGRFVREGRGQLMPTERQKLMPEDEVEEQAPTRASRSSRSSRSQRAARITPRIKPRPITATRTPGGRRQSERVRHRQVQRQLLQLEQEKKTKDKPAGYRELFQHGNYRVLDRSAMDEIEERAELQPGDDGIYVWNNDDKEQLLLNGLDGPHADFVMKDMTDRHIMTMDDEKGIAGAFIELPGPDKPLDPTSDDFAYDVHRHMDRLFAKHPDIEQVQVLYDVDGTVKFLGNKYSADPVVLVEVTDGFDPDKPFRLEFDSSIRHDELIPDFDEPLEIMRQMVSSLHFDADDAVDSQYLPMKITRPKIDLYRLENLHTETDEWDDEMKPAFRDYLRKRPKTDDQV